MKLYKYPRTPHLPWSKGATSDDKVLKDTKHLDNQNIVVTLKMDGENTTMYRHHIHARSLDSGDHPSRHWVKGLHAGLKYMIPDDWRVCGENLFAKHSIYYDNLLSYFAVFSVWNANNVCLSYEDTVNFCNTNGLHHVPVILKCRWSGVAVDIHRAFTNGYSKHEGYVVRLAREFKYEDFAVSVAKYVRENHVQTDNHWMHESVTPNKLRKE